MKPTDLVLTDRTKAPWHRPRLRWACTYGIPNGTHDGRITYSAAVGFGPTKRIAVARARAIAAERLRGDAS